MKCIFPDYTKGKAYVVCPRRVKKEIPIVVEIITLNQRHILNAHKRLAREKYPNTKPIVTMDLESAVRKVRNTSLFEHHEYLGLSDDESIWVNKSMKMNDALLRCTILHEALHYICQINGKDICTRDEHRVMECLGEN